MASTACRRSAGHRLDVLNEVQIGRRPRFGVAAFVRHWIDAFHILKFTVPRLQICLLLTQSYFGAAVVRRTFSTRSIIGSFARGVATTSMCTAIRWPSLVWRSREWIIQPTLFWPKR